MMLLATFCIRSEEIEPKDQWPQELKQFMLKAVADEEGRFMNVEKVLLATKKQEPLRDQKIEILSGLVWNVDRKRAHTLLKHIQNEKLRQKIQRHYKAMEDATKPTQTI